MKKRFLIYSIIISLVFISSGFINYDYFPNFGMAVYAESVRLNAPLDFKAEEITKTTIKLTWKRVDGADAYKVFIFNSETDEYESYKTVKNTSCTANGLSAGTTYKFKVAALKGNNGKYTVQNKSDKLVVKTHSSEKPSASKNIKEKKKKKQFYVPNAGDSVDSVLKNSGMVNVNDDSSGLDEYKYTGDTIAYGKECSCEVWFNSKKQCNSYSVYIPQNYDEFLDSVALCVIDFGDDYTAYIGEDVSTYVWEDSKIYVTMRHYKEEKTTVLLVVYINYLD